jgi:hypothetical protein
MDCPASWADTGQCSEAMRSHGSKSLSIRASHLFMRDPPQISPIVAKLPGRCNFTQIFIKIGRFYVTLNINDSPVESSKKLPCQNIASR